MKIRNPYTASFTKVTLVVQRSAICRALQSAAALLVFSAHSGSTHYATLGDKVHKAFEKQRRRRRRRTGGIKTLLVE